MPSPRVRVQPKGADEQESDGLVAVDLAASYGLVADDWQEDLLIDWLLLDGKGRWLSRTCGIAVPRQNGKNAAVEIRELYGVVVLGEKFLHTAHEVKTARKHFKRLKHFFGDHVNDPGAKYPELNALVKEIRSTNGQEAILLHHRDCPHFDGKPCNCGEAGGSVEIVARSKGSGRGFTVDVLVCDEAQDLTDDELEALLPTISSAPLGNPQIIFAGTPPNADKGETGEVFLRVRNDGEPGHDKAARDPFLAWTDFGVADGPITSIDFDSLPLLYANNPALRTGRLQKAVIDTEKRRFSLEGLARERYGWWGNRAGKRHDAFGEGRWEAIELELGDRPDPAAIGLSASVDGEWGSIGCVGPWSDGTYLIGAVDRRPGTTWMKAEAKRIQKKTGATVVIDPKGPAGHLIKPLKKAGVWVVEVTGDDRAKACGDLFQSVLDGDATHMGDEELDAAVEVVEPAKYGNRWVWALRTSAGDISMIDAVTNAWHARELAYDVEDSFL